MESADTTDFKKILYGDSLMKTYIHTGKDKRTRLIIKNDDGSMTSVSYPRILMEEKLGRPLEPFEDVHHIDGDTTNNSLDNLEIAIHGEHQRTHNPQKYFDKKVNCIICGREFIFTAKQQSLFQRDLNRNRRRGVTCSRKCAYLFGKQEQVRSDSNAECGLNGEPSPNGNTVPISIIESA